MALQSYLGRIVRLTVCELIRAGALLGDRDDQRKEALRILLPQREVTDETRLGDTLEVFVYLDSEDRPIATLRRPKLLLGEVVFLEAKALHPAGAFFDWGLEKDLLVPHREQTRPVRVGDREAVGLYLDRTERLAGTMRVAELLNGVGSFDRDEWVEGEAWRKDREHGVFVIVEKTFVGLLPASEPNDLERGQQAKFRVASVLPDGKLQLSLRRHAHEEIEDDAERILAVLQHAEGTVVGESASPEAIRDAYGLSKKAFKRALGNLFKARKITIDEHGTPSVVTKTKR